MNDPTRTAYRNQHYVPQWYQKRFFEPGARENVLYYLSLEPVAITDAGGNRRQLPPQRRRPVRKCFAEDDLYTLRFGEVASTAIEQVLFGQTDDRGSEAVSYWADFVHPSVNEAAFSGLLHYMSAQKLRTPKGLDWLRRQIGSEGPNEVLRAMVGLQGLYSAIWTECVWQLADASASETKFIVSDHPVTVYNRACGPRHEQCRGANDPDIRLHGSHTIFPLDLNRVLILTNLSWARNPHQKPTGWRPNPTFYRDTVFNFFDVQTNRSLVEEEVREINFIVKSRAYRYIAASNDEWLYPERFVSKSNWAHFGHGYLLMPDPRGLHHGGEALLEYADGSSAAFDDYGRKPGEGGYGTYPGLGGPRDPLRRFKREFAQLMGPARRSRSFTGGGLEPARDSDELHRHHLDFGRRTRH